MNRTTVMKSLVVAPLLAVLCACGTDISNRIKTAGGGTTHTEHSGHVKVTEAELEEHCKREAPKRERTAAETEYWTTIDSIALFPTQTSCRSEQGRRIYPSTTITCDNICNYKVLTVKGIEHQNKNNCSLFNNEDYCESQLLNKSNIPNYPVKPQPFSMAGASKEELEESRRQWRQAEYLRIVKDGHEWRAGTDGHRGLVERDAQAKEEGRYNEQICVVFLDPCIFESEPIAEITADYDHAAAIRRSITDSLCPHYEHEHGKGYNFCKESCKDVATIPIEEYESCLNKASSAYFEAKREAETP